MKLFIAPVVVSILGLIAIFFWGGWNAFILTAILSVLEITLSFDNAVVNAKVLAKMNETWQKRFLTWGILIAVFGTRIVLPIVIVAVALWYSPLAVLSLVISDSAEYARLLASVHAAIASFGGTFLLMVSLKYFFDEGKEVHWIKSIERHLARFGRIEAIEIAFALITILAISFFSHGEASMVLAAGIVGIVLFILMQGITSSLSIEGKDLAGAGFSLFVYLNVLDSAFSLDGVVGAFALTTALPIIAVGLGIGAYFVRSITVYLVRRKTLAELIYLEHGAHWAIFGLAACMLAGLLVHIPEIVIGGIGLVFVGLAYYSSLRHQRAAR